MSELPKGWVKANVGDLAVGIRSGFPSGRHNAAGIGIPHLRPMNVSRVGAIDLTDTKSVDPSAGVLRLERGDVLFNNTNSLELVGKTAVFDKVGNFAFSNHMTSVRFYPDCDPRFMARQLHYLWMAGGLRHLISNHVNQASIPGSRLGNEVELRVAPTNEQKRIVEAIDEAFSKLDAGEAGLQKVRQQLKQLRSSVLDAAVTGRLVPPDAHSIAIGGPVLGAEPQSMRSLGINDLPDSWSVTSLGSISTMSLGKMLDGKKQTGLYPTPYLRNINVRWFRFDLETVPTMDISPDEFPRVSLVSGDLVVCEGGEPGRCAVWDGPAFAIQKALHRVRPKEGVSSRYLALVIRWWSQRDAFDGFITGTTIKHIPKEKLRLLPIPLPSDEEQLRIVQEVERQFSFLEAAERAVEAGMLRSAGLRRAILKAAFEGHLVPQDPTDEPAAVLLERIRAERLASDGAKPKKTREKVSK